MSDEPSTCPHCGKPASPKLLGMCPQCMLKAGLGGFTAEGSIPEQAASHFTPPTVEELGRYFPQLEILELIGRGGMGAVYKARQKQLDRLVALKILPPGIGGVNTEAKTQNKDREPDPDATAFAQRFTREAKALAALAHPNIVTLYEFGQAFPGPRTSSSALSPPSAPQNTENQPNIPRPPIFFFLMEYVDGMNLRQLLSGGRLAPKEALAIVPHICDALQYAHDRGIVHRDIKPENILLGRDGVVKIADFGVAKIIGQVPPVPSPAEFRTSELASDAPAITSEKVMGTPAYMAPEQLERPAEVDHRADIYSLGVVLYQMLTGELPGKHIEPPSRKVQIDVRIDEIVMRALERNPDMRYSQASVFKTEVETIAGTPPDRGTTPPSGAAPTPLSFAAVPGGLPASRFSRTAIVGACWAPLFFIAFVSMFTAHTAVPAGDYSGPTWWQQLLAFSLLPLGITAPFGTTILGWVAVAQIRRSADRLYGLGLAVFDGLLFPLLALDGLIYWIVASGFGPDTDYRHASVPVFACVLVGTCVVVDWLIIQRAWRAVNGIAGISSQAKPEPHSRKLRVGCDGSGCTGAADQRRRVDEMDGY